MNGIPGRKVLMAFLHDDDHNDDDDGTSFSFSLSLIKYFARQFVRLSDDRNRVQCCYQHILATYANDFQHSQDGSARKRDGNDNIVSSSSSST